MKRKSKKSKRRRHEPIAELAHAQTLPKARRCRMRNSHNKARPLEEYAHYKALLERGHSHCFPLFKPK